MSKPLLFLPSPRDIEQVKDAVSKLKIDKLWVKYYPQEEAYDVARERFLNSEDYTHLIIHPDDMISTQANLDQLLRDLEQWPDIVISGWCNNTAGSTIDVDSNISTTHLPPNPPNNGTYDSYHWNPISDLLAWHDMVIPVRHQGFALTAIPRKVSIIIPFRASAGCCMDSCLSLDLAEKKIEQFVDTRIRTTHLKTTPDILQTGKKRKELIFEKC